MAHGDVLHHVHRLPSTNRDTALNLTPTYAHAYAYAYAYA